MPDVVFKGDVGTVLRATLYEPDRSSTTSQIKVWDISTATLMRFKLVLASGTQLTKTATFTTDGTDGKMQTTLTTGGASDLTVSGPVTVQAYLELPSWSGHVSVTSFVIDPVIF